MQDVVLAELRCESVERREKAANWQGNRVRTHRRRFIGEQVSSRKVRGRSRKLESSWGPLGEKRHKFEACNGVGKRQIVGSVLLTPL